MRPVLQDLRYALKQVGTHPGYSIVVVLTLALSIGANTAIFSVVDALLLRPLPYPQPQRLGSLSGRRNSKRAGGGIPESRHHHAERFGLSTMGVAPINGMTTK